MISQFDENLRYKTHNIPVAYFCEHIPCHQNFSRNSSLALLLALIFLQVPTPRHIRMMLAAEFLKNGGSERRELVRRSHSQDFAVAGKPVSAFDTRLHVKIHSGTWRQAFIVARDSLEGRPLITH